MAISIKNTKQNSNETILEKYRLLESFYSSLYKDEGANLFSRSAMPSYLPRLLPISDGWCFSPLWEAPRPVEHWSGKFLSIGDLATVTLPPRAVEALGGIEKEIVRHATTCRLIFHAVRLVETAIDNSRPRAENTETQQGTYVEAVNSEDYLSAFRAGRSWAALDDKPTEVTESNIERLRFDWLIGWRDLLVPTVRGLGRRSGIYSKRYEVQQSIGIDQIRRVNGLFIKTSSLHGEHPTDLLGRWYQLMLLRCAATESDLDRIKRTHWASAQRRAPKVITQDRLWGRVALKRLANHVNYKERLTQSIQS